MHYVRKIAGSGENGIRLAGAGGVNQGRQMAPSKPTETTMHICYDMGGKH
jgi:hypothetical protein